MNLRLQHFAESYAALEQRVQNFIHSICAGSCTLCSTCCCRADLCEEALDSPFLKMLHRRDELESDAYGFLTETGCALTAGRPPVCYEFFCAELLAGIDAETGNLLRIAGELLLAAGNISGDLQIADLSAAELARLDLTVLENQLCAAENIMNQIS
ncbi:MAG: hypothetical protein WC959_02150 [Kiritimatiellales bacterium]